MGYLGLRAWGESDLAASFVFTVFEDLIKRIKKELKQKGNEFNTDGVVNVSLYLEKFVFPLNAEDVYDACEEIVEVLDNTIIQLEKLIKNDEKKKWKDEADKQFHIGRYKEFIKNTKKYRKKLAPYADER